ncbi:hypothetical protein [Desulforhopalus sp. IMCC35007]|uniref:hypothetical protein n=1 Tax=Desulforhopalus sp. IMCC35007 TaxID=2569543 RepID=UPI0010AE988F|nr:hypothetical protein [Desulforhopalus sp. IMCC35007]TKB06940.1 hypothetical protein FCL48_19295 [Desulforhopalus sp. IMCC35007]
MFTITNGVEVNGEGLGSVVLVPVFTAGLQKRELLHKRVTEFSERVTSLLKRLNNRDRPDMIDG